MKRFIFPWLQAALSLAVAMHLTAATAAAQCGNGVIDPGEGCDPPAPPCCSAACQCVLGATCTGCFAPGFCNYTGAPSTCVCDANVEPPPLDHYTVYDAFGPDGGVVTMRDQFQTQTQLRLGRADWFMPPTRKNNEEIHDEIPHLTCYMILEGQFAASVLVTNQFDVQQLTVGNPQLLCVPTEKNPGADPLPLNRDHYKCYEAQGTSVNRRVTLQNQFEDLAVTVTTPRWFCTPVDKNGEGILNPFDHLTCYDFLETPGGLVGAVPVRNQFYEASLTNVCCPQALCVPSQKLEVQVTACADSAPQCNGDCPQGEACVDVVGAGCRCQSVCSVTFPQCGGVCPPGETCYNPGTACACRPAV